MHCSDSGNLAIETIAILGSAKFASMQGVPITLHNAKVQLCNGSVGTDFQLSDGATLQWWDSSMPWVESTVAISTYFRYQYL